MALANHDGNDDNTTKRSLMSRTMAVHVRYKSLYISLLSSAKQRHQMTKFCVFWKKRERRRSRAISEFPCASVSKRVQMQNHSYENDFDLYENETACRTHFHMKGFARRQVLNRGTRELGNGLFNAGATCQA